MENETLFIRRYADKRPSSFRATSRRCPSLPMSHSLAADGISSRLKTASCSSEASPKLPSLSIMVRSEARGSPEQRSKRGKNPVGAVKAARLAIVLLLAFANITHYNLDVRILNSPISLEQSRNENSPIQPRQHFFLIVRPLHLPVPSPRPLFHRFCHLPCYRWGGAACLQGL